jgi:hypothetical protein
MIITLRQVWLVAQVSLTRRSSLLVLTQEICITEGEIPSTQRLLAPEAKGAW